MQWRYNAVEKTEKSYLLKNSFFIKCISFNAMQVELYFSMIIELCDWKRSLIT